jgi:hypothetical protein
MLAASTTTIASVDITANMVNTVIKAAPRSSRL